MSQHILRWTERRAIAVAKGLHIIDDKKFLQEENAELRAALEQARSPDSGKVAEGWKLVPLEATEEMRAVAASRFVGTSGFYSSIYSAMVAAAPAADNAATEQAISDTDIAKAVRPLYSSDEAAQMGLVDDIRTVRAVLQQQPAERSDSAAEPVAWLLRHGEFTHFSGAVVCARRELRFNKPEKDGYYSGCDDFEVTPLYAAAPASADVGELPTETEKGHHEYIATICDAYESGMGHGLDGKPLINPYSYRDSPDQHSAFETGHELGIERRNDQASSAALPKDEREAFADWARPRGYNVTTRIQGRTKVYVESSTTMVFDAWMARAALSASAEKGDEHG